jgi:hypothetical protein
MRVELGPIDRDVVQGASNVSDQPEAGRHIGRHAPAPLMLAESGSHDLGVVTRSTGNGEIVESVGALHSSQIKAPRLRGQEGSRRTGRRRWNAQIACEQITGSAGDDAEGNVGADQCGGGLHRGPVAAEHHDDIHSFSHAVLRELTCVPGSSGRQHFHCPAAAA